MYLQTNAYNETDITTCIIIKKKGNHVLLPGRAHAGELQRLRVLLHVLGIVLCPCAHMRLWQPRWASFPPSGLPWKGRRVYPSRPSRPVPIRPGPPRTVPTRPAPARPDPSRPSPSRLAPARPYPARPSPPRPVPARPGPYVCYWL